MQSLLLATATEQPARQSQAASSLWALSRLAETRSDELPAESVEAMAALMGKYTVNSRGHAALALSVSALSPSVRELLLEAGVLKPLLALAAEGDPEAEGATALLLALLVQSEAARTLLLEEAPMASIGALLISTNPDAVRCAVCVLASLAELPAGAAQIVAAFPPKLVVMLLRSKDAIVQAASARLHAALALEPDLWLRLLHAQCVPALVEVSVSSRSAVARFEAMHALRIVSERSDEAMARQEREQATRVLLRALAEFGVGLLQVATRPPPRALIAVPSPS